MSEHEAVRIAVENYFACLDLRDWDGLAGCFTDDAQLQYGIPPVAIVGGAAFVEWVRPIGGLLASNHAISNQRLRIDGDRATAETNVVATLVGTAEQGARATIRGLDYHDELRRTEAGWLISARVHRPIWQYAVDGVIDVGHPAEASESH
jgi:hypothetical protein